ncbi:MAG TPA: tetratricopeptide repeat protein [Candidatus Aminicenantes bacterium]|nr:tetratricopeptide repeat protein [Candidatus Aminicenantes bacterium]
MESASPLESAWKVLGLAPGATIEDARKAYFQLARHPRFQRVILTIPELCDEFTAVHSAYIRILRHIAEQGQAVDMGYRDREEMYLFLFNQGLFALLRDNVILAGEKFLAASQIEARHVPLLLYLGILLTRRKNYYAAEKYFRQAIRLEPENDDALFYLGDVYFRAGRLVRAIQVLERAKQLNPTRSEIAFKLKEIREFARIQHENRKKSVLKKIVRSIRDALDDEE